MDENSNTPVSASSSGVAEWFSIWVNAVSKPNEATYAAMAEHPDAQTNTRAFTWVFLAGTVSAIISGLLNGILQMAGVASQTPGLSELLGNSAPRGGLAGIGIALCSSPIAGAVSVLFFAVFVGIIQWVAKMFKGTGNFSQLAYATAAISVPLSLVTSLLSPFQAIQYVGYCASGISALLGIYGIFLQLSAVKAVNKFGWGEAAGSYFLPLFVLGCLCFCIAFGLASALGAGLGDVFDQINQQLGQ